MLPYSHIISQYQLSSTRRSCSFVLFGSFLTGTPPPPPPPKKYPPNLKDGPRGAKFKLSECQNYTDKSISQIPPGGSKLGGYLVKTSRPGDGDHLRGGTDNTQRKLVINKTF